MKILVTAGGTKEYIDGVRYIGNSSSGQTGAELVDFLTQQGHAVTWLGAKDAVKPQEEMAQLTFETFDDLSAALKDELSECHYDLVFQVAAVSDFKVASVLLDGEQHAAGRGMKLPTSDEVQLVLTKQPKLVSMLKEWSVNTKITVVAFKLTNSLDASVRRNAVKKLIVQQEIDQVAHNDLNEITDMAHGFQLYGQDEQIVACHDVQALANAVVNGLGYKK